jgi:L-Ala-D/L-Glu epimerase / N-acetyl-D-glutamate racemase
MPGLPAEQFAARAAIDAALHDLCGKLVGEPVWRLLGLERSGPPTSWTIGLGDPDEMARKAERANASGRFKRLKLKIGGRDGLDVERVRAVEAVSDVPIQVDVNEYWTLAEALDALPQLHELGVEFCEQPLRRGDEDGAELAGASPIPIYVDEDCHTLADVAGCAKIAHGINIKLAKSGGIREAVRMAHAARALGLGVMVGCMIESGLGIAAGAAVASLCDFVDLDGNLLIAHDPWPGVELVDGVQTPSEAPGLGVRQAVPSPR